MKNRTDRSLWRSSAPTFFEALESRTLLSAALAPGADISALSATPAFHLVADPSGKPGGGGGITNPTPTGYTPSQIRKAYGFDQVTFLSGSVIGDGTGQTIAIVDAYDDPNIVADLKVFDATFGLSDKDGNGAFALTKHTMSNKVQANAGWALEIALDVEWAHAVAPGAHILLVEAKSSSFTDLFSAVDYARSQSGVVSVSMSWDGSEFSSETLYDYHFTTPAGHGGVTFLAASGDSGAPAEWPAISPNVVAVGGTSLYLTSTDPYSYLSETGWSGSGGGISLYEAKPSYQSGVTQSSTMRTNPDVAYNADPNTGFAVYDSLTYQSRSGWFQVGGTSAGSPQWAALIAIVDQGRALKGQGSLDGPSQTLPALYSLPGGDFHDVAAAGYDLVTGLGSPLANLVIGDLVAATSAAVGSAPAQPAPADGLAIAATAGHAGDAKSALNLGLPVGPAQPSALAHAQVAQFRPTSSASPDDTDASLEIVLTVL